MCVQFITEHQASRVVVEIFLVCAHRVLYTQQKEEEKRISEGHISCEKPNENSRDKIVL